MIQEKPKYVWRPIMERQESRWLLLKSNYNYGSLQLDCIPMELPTGAMLLKLFFSTEFSNNTLRTQFHTLQINTKNGNVLNLVKLLIIDRLSWKLPRNSFKHCGHFFQNFYKRFESLAIEPNCVNKINNIQILWISLQNYRTSPPS